MAGERGHDETNGGGAGERSPAERRALIDSFTRTAAERGYAQTTAERVAAGAGLDRADFEAHFAGMQQCMAAAYDAFAGRLTEQIEGSCRGQGAWPAQVRAAVGESLELLAEAPSRARLFAVEGMQAGPAVVERHFALINRLSDLLSRGRLERSGAAELPEATEWVLIGGVASRVCAHLLAEEPGALGALAPEVVELVLAPYVGGAEARRLAGR